MADPVYYFMFDPANGLYLGYGEASPDPESGGHFLPYGATFITPPLCTAHQILAWRSGAWCLLSTIPRGVIPSWSERIRMAWDMLFGRRSK